MAEAVLFTLTNDILKLAGSDIFSKIQLVRGARDDLSRLTYTVETIQTVLLDAEKKQWDSEQVKLWLVRLKDVLYDAQDLLDDVTTEDLRRKVTPGNKISKAVRFFFSNSNHLARPYKVAKRIQAIRKKLDWIAKDKEFRLEEHPSEKSMAIGRGKKTENFAPDREIIGRKKDKKKIKQLLFDSSSSQRVSFVAIVGKGGLGKTALARLVYRDGEVEGHFRPDCMWWVCVSDVFDVNLIIKKILKSANCPNLENVLEDHLESLLDETVSTKKYLLVLDDLWNEDRFKWLKLERWLKGGLQGSKILLTTRSHEVAKVVDLKSDIHELHGLSRDKSWDLFRKMAFADGVESLDPELEQMGRDIVNKCAGVPLAIRTIGSLLYGKNKDEWLRYKGHEFPEIPEIDAVDEGIIQVLKLSYDHLPSSLKHCFAYCSLFPKGYTYQADIMIHLWVAQGFIESRDREDNLEEVAYKYLLELIFKSFLEVDTIEYGNVHKVKLFKVHDLMHDLAQKVAGGECKIVNSKEGDNDRGIRHMSYISETFSEEKMMSLLRTSKLRTFLLKKEKLFSKRVSVVLNCNKVFSSCGHCRVLYLEHEDIPLPPSSFGKLKQLRFLYIFGIQSIRSLPDSITDLVNLQTLELVLCFNLKTFPRDLRKLVNLRHLLINGGRLRCLPPLSKLPSLRTLSLESLDELRFIQQKRRSDNSRSSFPKLQSMTILDCLRLNCVPSFPHVEYLSIHGTKMLDQQLMGNLLMANLNCPSNGAVEATPIPFRKLRGLTLHHINMNLDSLMLKTLFQLASNLKYMGLQYCDLRSHSREMQDLSLLEELYIWNCQGLDLSCQEDEHGTQWQCLTNLRALTIEFCGNLVALPEGIQHVTTLQSLHISSLSSLRHLPKWIGNFSLLNEFELSCCRILEHIPSEIRNLTCLKKLRIHECPKLDRRCLVDVHTPIIVLEDDSSDSD